MLRNFRQVFKGSKTPMTVVMGVVLLGLVAYLAPSGADREAPDNVLARVYGRDVLRREVEQKVADTVRRLGKQVNLETMGAYLQSQALESLVGQKLAEELAERHGIVVTDAEVAAALEARLRMYPIFLQNGSLRSTSEINGILKESGTSLNIWEKEVRLEQAVTKLKAQAAASIPVDEAWVERENRTRNEKISFESVTLAPDASAVADPGDARLQALLTSSGARFQVGPRRVIQYISVQPGDFGNSLQPDEASIKAAYESRQAQYLELKASHILFLAKSDAEYLEATQKAEALREKLLTGQDFNKAALEQSQDPSAKSNRGELGWFKLATMDKGFSEGARALKEGEISRPVRSSFGIHLIKLEGRKTKTLDEVKAELSAQLLQDRFIARAKDRLEQVRKAAGAKGDLSAPARNQSLKVQLSNPLLDEPGTKVEGLGEADPILAEVFGLKVGQVSKVLPLGNRFVLFRVQEERPVAVPPLKEIRDRVLAAFRMEESRRLTLESAKTKLQGGDLKALGTTATQQAVNLASLNELAQHSGIRRALLDTAVGQTTPILWTPDGKLWVAKITARIPANPLNFESRHALVAELQGRESIKLLQTELQALDTQGRQKPGFSSLWGRFRGIWVNQEALSRTRSAQTEAE
ncbi:peptidylprolyl isomerase [Holophaga foetida]|uniref:peptidylprolyl isomerase n=1 Tax=Holophaga foetida TaxID=35839 RepID=UPI0002475005|nr:peptidyl-prolyl cis-trans isomerase [Holophaga foetida]